MVGRIKEGPQRGATAYIILGVIIFAAVFLAVRWYRVSKNENSEAWTYFDLGEEKALQETYPETNPGKALRFQQAWYVLWNQGIKKLGADQKGGLDAIAMAQKYYEMLLKEVEGDPFWEPEALYGLAQIEETRAITDSATLDRALEMYQDLAKKHSDAAFGELAKARAEALGDSAKRKDIEKTYQELRNVMRFDRK